MRSLLLGALCALSLANALARPIPSPAGAGSLGSSLASAPDGGILMSWLEPDGPAWALKFSWFDAATESWGPGHEIARGENWFVNWADFPSVTPLSNETLLAVWFVENPPSAAGGAHDHGAGYRSIYSLSYDRGRTWSAAQPITGESAVTEFTTVLPLEPASRALVAWLDGRARPVQRLYAQTLLADGADALVDPSVCDCCQLALVRVGEGALLAYRGRTSGEIRDIRLARWRNGAWEAPQTLHDDKWEIAACPVNGPRLAVRDDHVIAVWFTGAQGEARVQAKRSRDGGATFGGASRLDVGRPQGRLDVVLRRDGTAYASWLEFTGRDHGSAGGIYLRAIAADGTLGEPELIAPSSTNRASGFPRLALVDDRRLLVSYTATEGDSRVATLLVPLN